MRKKKLVIFWNSYNELVDVMYGDDSEVAELLNDIARWCAHEAGGGDPHLFLPEVLKEISLDLGEDVIKSLNSAILRPGELDEGFEGLDSLFGKLLLGAIEVAPEVAKKQWEARRHFSKASMMRLPQRFIPRKKKK
ncbi:MAG: hypothetical protein Q7R64_03065 [bacterium]|nr:hypothetical protein [bacterium]